MLCFSENLFCSSPGGTSSLLAIDAPQPRAEGSPEWLGVLGKERVPGVMVEVVQGSSSAYPCSFSCIYPCLSSGGFPSGSAGKKPPANKEMQQDPQVQSLGWEDPLEKEMANCSNILPGKIPWTEEHGGYSPGLVRSWSQKSQK